MGKSFGSLFSGIGGIDLGLERAGFTCEWQVENDPFCQKVLQKHWPNVARYGDIRDIDTSTLAHVDLIAGGFPCQDISSAGKQTGITGEQSGLWKEFFRIICELRPRFVVIENVKNLLSGGEWNEHESDTCICGWNYRWGGMHHYLCTSEQQRDCLCSSSGCGNERESDKCAAISGNELWRTRKKEQRKDGQVGGGLYVDDMRESNCSVLSEDTTIPYSQSRASAIRAKSSEYDNERTGIVLQMDARDERKGTHYAGSDARTQPQRADCIHAIRMVCPSCGRDMDNSTKGDVYRSWMGVILRDLAACGYDAQWFVLSAARFGAPHLRERVFIVAYSTSTRCEEWQEAAGTHDRSDTSSQYALADTQCLFSHQCDIPPMQWRWSGSPQQTGVGCGDVVNSQGDTAGRDPVGDETPFTGSACDGEKGYAPWRTGQFEPDMGRMFARIPPGMDRYSWPAFPGQPQYEWEPPRTVTEQVLNRSSRLKALGNAVVPQIAEYIGRAILESEAIHV